MNHTVAVVAAHPDDEVLGCGATIAKHVRSGDAVHVLFLAQGIRSRPESTLEQLSELRTCAHRASKILGVTSLEFEEFPDNRLDSVDRLTLVQRVERFLETHRPDTMYTHLPIDLNIDHARVHEAVVTACRPLPGSPVRQLLLFEVPSSTGWRCDAPAFAPNWYVDVTETADIKLKALREYTGEIRAFPHARSLEAVEALLRWRGASAGVAAAEAFELGRRIVD